MSENSRSWMYDEEFIAECERYGGNLRSADRKFFLSSLLRLVAGLPGDLAECGCFEGASARVLARSLGGERQLHLFDSFEGLSNPEPSDGTWWTEGDLSASEERLRGNLSDFQGVRIHKGWIPTTFDELSAHSFRFVHVDVDLYEPTRDSVEFFYPRLVPGGILVCDDYGFITCPGAHQAMEEFFAVRPEPIVHVPTGQGFVIKR